MEISLRESSHPTPDRVVRRLTNEKALGDTAEYLFLALAIYVRIISSANMPNWNFAHPQVSAPLLAYSSALAKG
jgi:hypothetical protein